MLSPIVARETFKYAQELNYYYVVIGRGMFGWFKRWISKRFEPEILARITPQYEERSRKYVSSEVEKVNKALEIYKGELDRKSQEEFSNKEKQLEKNLESFKAQLEERVKSELEERKNELQRQFDSEKQKLDADHAELKSRIEQESKEKDTASQKLLAGKLAELEKRFADDKSRLETKYELDFKRKAEEQKKTLKQEIDQGFATQVREAAESDLIKTYGNQLRQARKVPELEKQVLEADEKVQNMGSLLAKAREAIAPLYQQALEASTEIRTDYVDAAKDYLKRDSVLALEVLALMRSSGKRSGYVKCFFDAFCRINALAGDIDAGLMRRLVISGLAIDDVRAVSYWALKEMEINKTWSEEDRKKFIQARIDSSIPDAEIKTAREFYSKDEQHKDFCAGLTKDEIKVIKKNAHFYVGQWEKYAADIDKLISGIAKDDEPWIFSERKIINTLMEYEKHHKVYLHEYLSE